MFTKLIQTNYIFVFKIIFEYQFINFVEEYNNIACIIYNK